MVLDDILFKTFDSHSTVDSVKKMSRPNRSPEWLKLSRFFKDVEKISKEVNYLFWVICLKGLLIEKCNYLIKTNFRRSKGFFMRCKIDKEIEKAPEVRLG